MPGELTTIVGPMGSGKTLELVKLLSQYERAGYKPHLFKHEIDDRDEESICTSRAGYELPATTIRYASDIDRVLLLPEGLRVFALEEGEFFEEDMVEFIHQILFKTDHRVVVTGLNLNFRSEPFGIMPQLMAMSDHLIFQTGICDVCHGPASKTQRLIDGKPAPYNSPEVVVGGSDMYASRCVQCYVLPT